MSGPPTLDVASRSDGDAASSAPVGGPTKRAVHRTELACLALILAVLLAALVYEAWTTGITVDEPAHLLSSRLYWQRADHLLPRDMPPLIKIVAGWVPALLDPPMVRENKDLWKRGWEFPIANEMVAEMSAERSRRIFFFSRLPMLLFPLLTAVLLWWWARQVFAAPAALLVTLAFALEPTALAHGSLLKNDLAATFTYLLFCYRAWRFWLDPRMRNAVWLGIALLLAIIAKMSMLFLLPVAPTIVLICARRGQKTRAAWLILAIAYFGSLAAWQFEARRISQEEMKQRPLPRIARAAAHVFHILPVPDSAWEGALSLYEGNREGSPVYLIGRRYPHGHPAYFLVALAVKTSIVLQFLVAAGIAVAARHRPRALLWLLPAALYLGLASLLSLQFGVRLVLPALPFALLIAGAAIDRLLSAPWNPAPGGMRFRATSRFGSSARWLVTPQALVALVFLLLAVESGWVYPHGISFFNLWAGGPDHGLTYLADSNLDWGQDLPLLAEYVHFERIRGMRLSYFGTASPIRCFRPGEVELIPPPWNEDLARGCELAPLPGWWAISATLLPGHFFEPRYRDYYRAFRGMRPVARAGYSIYIYRVPER